MTRKLASGRRVRRLGLVLGAGIAVALAGPAPSLANHAPETCTANSQNAIGCVLVTDTPDPVSYSSFDGNQTFLRYRAVVTNRSRSGTLSHVDLTEALPPGTTCVSAATTRGTASCGADSASASISQLKRGQAATVDVVVTAPATSDPDPPDLTIVNQVTVAFSDNNPNDPGKDATVTYSETTTVTKDAGQSFCPEGESCQVDTDPDQIQYANALVPDPKSDLLVTLGLLPEDAFCVDGTVRISGKNYVCREGGFVDVSVTDVDSGAQYVDTANPLVFHLRWEASLVDPQQRVRNFVVFYRTDASSPVQVISEVCNAGATNTPCLRNIAEEADGAWSVDLVKPDNGHMR
jgi:uncharacterized repeat protein (TIGR01451 family)